ncbi:MAG: nucleotidyl transferase AbiEii/AbiGii toxin family protein [Prevotellaceae bacterium]|nr:nucleotidyl transferase AbiEii/AbiGii toxin family protein [Prevotellaceae bacterium]
MNSQNTNTHVYAQKVELLLRLIPIVMEEGVFAIHGGTAINLFLKNLPRYSVDIDLTYIPLSGRTTSLDDINNHLKSISEKAKKAFKGMHIVPNFSTCKLLCEYRGKQVKIEVNQTKRGIVGGDVLTIPLSDKAQEEFSLYCEANIVPLTLLYGGKIAAALSRQHPRDLFDVKYMELPMAQCREGFIFCLLGSDRPIYESFAPSLIDQREAMENQFEGMTDTPFTYEEFEETRTKLIAEVNNLMTDADKHFLVSFELAEPDWEGYEFEYFKEYPSVQWKLLNLKKLAKMNPQKLKEEADKLKRIFRVE